MRALLLALAVAMGWGPAAAAQERADPAPDPAGATPEPADSVPPLLLGEVLSSVEETYPPLLEAYIERDVREGRLRSARGVTDFDLYSRLFGTPSGYYESSTVDAGFEQFTGIWGSTLYGGYRLTWGDSLPDYYRRRTQGSGEPQIGVKVPLLQGGPIDPRRAEIQQAQVEAEAAEPLIQRQRLDFLRAATVAYYEWLAAGRALQFAERLLRITNERQEALEEQVRRGLRPPIDLVDNERLVVSRELKAIEARRKLEGATLALSLFYRDERGEPRIPSLSRLPEDFPETEDPTALDLEGDILQALEIRPEIQRLELDRQGLEVQARLANNALLPKLDAGLSVSRNQGEELYKDRTRTEVKGELAFQLPLQQRKARGKVQELDAKRLQLLNKRVFAADKIQTEIRNVYAGLLAAWEQTQRAQRNVELARELQAAEEARFRQGASDLLALQIREQAAFDAQVSAVEAFARYFKEWASYRAAVVGF